MKILSGMLVGSAGSFVLETVSSILDEDCRIPENDSALTCEMR